MPELPEVQTIVNDFIASGIIGRTIEKVQVRWPRTVAGMPVKSFSRCIRGKRIIGIRRRAKYIIFQLDNESHLIVHLRMTGRFVLGPSNNHAGGHVHLSMALDDRRWLHFHDTRKFGRFYLVIDPMDILGKLGPEPLDDKFTALALWNLIQSRQRQVKPLLLDQRFLAGLGNIYVDEALWTARIHPQTTADRLTREQVKALHRAIRQVLRRGLKNAGTTLGRGKTNFYSIRTQKGNNAHYLRVFRRTGKPCPRCRRSIERIRIGQRSTHICANCQPLR